MNYYAIRYSKREYFLTWRDWAWWIVRDCATYFPDIRQVCLIRILGVEFKVMRWAPQSERVEVVWRHESETPLGVIYYRKKGEKS